MAKVQKVFRRSHEAEGNPLHKSFARTPLEEEISVEVFGLAGSFDWHRDKQVRERNGAGQHPNDRAILFQTTSNLKRLQSLFPNVPTLFEDNSFGENVLVHDENDEMSADNLCVGDILEVRRTEETRECLVLQITSPRWPCYKVDKRHPLAGCAQSNENKVRGHCCGTGLAGFFCKVVSQGSLAVGDHVVISQRVRPSWTLERVSYLFYGKQNRKTAMLDDWNGSEAELKECLQMKELAEFEWRDRLKKFVEKRKARRILLMKRFGILVAVLVAILAILSTKIFFLI